MKIVPVVAAMLMGIAAPPAAAQEEIKPKAEYTKTFQMDGETVAFATGVEILPFRMETKGNVKEMQLRADRAILWFGAGEKTAGFTMTGARRVYAEGNVVLTRRDVTSQKLEVFRAEQFYLDFQSRTGYFRRIRVDQRPGDETRPAVTLRAREARLSAGGTDPAAEAGRVAALGLPGFHTAPPGRLTAFDVVLSTCTFGDPHYHLGLAEAQVDWTFPKPGEHPLADFAMAKPEDPGIGGDWVTINIWGVPVFAWPSFYVKLAALSALPLEKLQGGRTSRFGTSVESTWGLRIKKGFIDMLNPFDESTTDDDGDTYGKVRWEIDYREKRGWAYGLDPSWKWDGYWGYLDSYYMPDDDGPDPGNDFDRQFLPLEDSRRGRARIFHRHDVTEKLRIEGEGSWLSDRNLLPEFFEKEFKEGKEQETVAYVRYLDGNLGGFLMGRVRINDFQTQLEYLPRGKVFWANETLAPTLPFGWNFSEELEIANLNQKFDDDLNLRDEQTWRFDSLSSWTLGVPLGVATLSPFAEARITAWEETLDGDPADRFIASAGVKLATDIWGDHDVTSDLLGLHRMRHIIHLEARAVTSFSNTLDPGGLFPYDAVDGLDDYTEFSFEFRNRFLTKYIDGQEFRTRDWLEIGLEFEYYPDAPRDTVGFHASNFSYPFNWITLAPHDATKILDERDWSNVHWDILFRPSNYLEGRGTGAYNPVDHQEEVRDFTVTVRPHEGLALSVGQMFVFDVTNAFTVGARWDLTEKWFVTAEGQFDFKTDEFTNRKATVGRDFHDFRFEVNYEEDKGRDERRFYVSFAPTFLKIPQ